MATLPVQDDDDVILVEFATKTGVRSVSLNSEDVVEKSKKAIENTMKTMRAMASKTMKTIKTIPVSERPTTFQVEFGIKFDAEGCALVAKASAEASITITMTWEHTSKAK